MVAKLPNLFASNHKPSGVELLQLWSASKQLTNIAGYSSAGGVTLTGGGANINTLFGQNVNFTKLGSSDETYVLAFVSVDHFWASGTPATVVFGVGMGNGLGFNVDTDIIVSGGTANNHHDPTYAFNKILGIESGTYTPSLYYRVSTGTITVNNGDTVMMYLWEVPYGG